MSVTSQLMLGKQTFPGAACRFLRCRSRNSQALFDDHVGASKERLRHRHPECFRIGRLREFRRLLAHENAAGIDRYPA
jgi:hypothetical protein